MQNKQKTLEYLKKNKMQVWKQNCGIRIKVIKTQKIQQKTPVIVGIHTTKIVIISEL